MHIFSLPAVAAQTGLPWYWFNTFVVGSMYLLLGLFTAAMVRGVGKMLEDLSFLKKVAIPS